MSNFLWLLRVSILQVLKHLIENLGFDTVCTLYLTFPVKKKLICF